MSSWKRDVVLVIAPLVGAKVIDAMSDHLPSWLDWLGSGASFAWTWLSKPATMPVYVVIIFLLILIRVVWEANQFIEATKAKERAELERRIRLSAEEELVMDALAFSNGDIEINELQQTTKLTRLRLDHAITSLRQRNFVRLNDEAWGVYVKLNNAGRAHIVNNNMDKPPF